MTKNLLVIGLILFASCKYQTPKKNNSTVDSIYEKPQPELNQIDTNSKDSNRYIGVFEYVYPYNLPITTFTCLYLY